MHCKKTTHNWNDSIAKHSNSRFQLSYDSVQQAAGLYDPRRRKPRGFLRVVWQVPGCENVAGRRVAGGVAAVGGRQKHNLLSNVCRVHKIAADKTEIICLMSAGYTALDSICEQSLDEHSLESMNEAPGVADRRNL